MAKRRHKRKRPGYVRPSRAQAKPGWTLQQLAELSGVAARTIRLYIAHDLLPRPPFLGSATRYQREHLVSLVAIRHLRASERLGLTEIRSRCRSMSSSAIESLVSQQALPAPLASALGMAAATSAAQTMTTPSRAIEPAQLEREDELAQTPRWIRAEL